MSKRNSRHSSNLEEKNAKTSKVETTEGNTEMEHHEEEEITKKVFTSTETSVKTSAKPTKTEKKEYVKMNLSELKNLKNLRKKQEHILMKIENDNIEKHVSGLLEKFDPPYCSNCPKRRADRVCINKKCGVNNYMQLICGKCHLDEHQKSATKPEIDIDEYFIKLSTFMNEQKYDQKITKHIVQRIDIDQLETIFDDIDLFRRKLDGLRSKLQSEIEGYISPQEQHGLLQNSITKALSLCEYDNIQEQLVNVKKSVLFEKNKFFWNDAGEKFKQYTKIFTDLDKTAQETNKKISKSFIGGMSIDLNDIKFKISTALSFGAANQSDIVAKDDVIKISNTSYNNSQYYMNFTLDKEKKYKFRFRFETQPTQYIMVGVMPKANAENNWVYNIPNQYFSKRFLSNSPTTECSRIIRGSDLSSIPRQGMQIEMRIDFENNYIDYCDYPEMKNINANHKTQMFTGSEYVIAFAFYQINTVVVESFEEVAEIEKFE